MTPPAPLVAREWRLLVLAACVRVLLDGAELVSHPLRFKQWEEAYNASVSRFLWTTDLWSQILPLQYKAFCGGCTVVAAVASPVVGLAGDHLLAWKSVALAWTVAELVVGFFALDRHVGRAAAWAWAVLWACPPTGVSDLALMLWGNHQESALFVLGALALLDRPFAAGLCAGLGVWFCRTSAYGALAVAPLLLARRGRHLAVLGALVGLSPFLLQSAVGDVGPNRIHVEGNVFPAGWKGVWDRAGYLFGTRELAFRQFIARADSEWLSGVSLAVAAVSAVLCAWRARVALWLVVVWVVLLTGTGIPIYLMRLTTPLTNARYHAPWLMLLVWIAAAGVGVAWTHGRRWLGGILLAVALFPGALSQGERLAGWAWSPLALTLPGGTTPVFLVYAAGRLAPEKLDVRPADPWAAGVMAMLRGLDLGKRVFLQTLSVDDAVARAQADAEPLYALRGLGHALANVPLSAQVWTERLASLPPADGDALALGMALDQGLRRRRMPGDPAAAVAEALRSLPADADPRLRGMAGPPLAVACNNQDQAATWAACIVAGSQDPYVLRVAGISAGRPDRDPSHIAAALAALPPAAAEAFGAGTDDLLAGLDSPFEPARLGMQPPPGVGGPQGSGTNRRGRPKGEPARP